MATLAFMRHSIVPDVLNKTPENVLYVKYLSSGQTVNLGNELTPTNVRDRPEVTYRADPNTYYTLIFTDPDVPSRTNPIRREFRHWLVVNIPGSNIARGQVLNEYIGAGAPKNTGLHRYVFLLFRQPKQLQFEEKRLTKVEVGDRPKFCTQKFADKYGLEIVAGNFFQAQYDDYVPELVKRMGLQTKV